MQLVASAILASLNLPFESQRLFLVVDDDILDPGDDGRIVLVSLELQRQNSAQQVEEWSRLLASLLSKKGHQITPAFGCRSRQDAILQKLCRMVGLARFAPAELRMPWLKWFSTTGHCFCGYPVSRKQRRIIFEAELGCYLQQNGNVW